MTKAIGAGVGKGHGSNTAQFPKIREKNIGLALGLQPGTKQFKMGKCTILISPPVPGITERWQGDGWHMSISRQDHYPSWDEIAHAWYSLVPNAETRLGVMILPPYNEYINIHNHCFHIHEDIEQETS